MRVENLQPRVDGLALEREYAEDALVDPEEWLAADESLQGFNSERKSKSSSSLTARTWLYTMRT